MRLLSHTRGFGRLDEDDPSLVHPMGPDILAYLAGRARPESAGPVRTESLEVTAPVPRPGKVVGVGLNYRDHARETGKPLPEEPVLFAKYANSVVGDGATVTIPRVTAEVDWEAELGVIIGRAATDVPVGRALDHVAGYTCLNDLSARDLQRRGGQWTRGKAIDGFLPMGPHLVTPDEIADVQALRIGCAVNGETVQGSITSEMVFGVAELISIISQTITLEPGDCIATGTPPGVGVAMDPPRFLQPADEVSVTIERLGTLSTRLSSAG